MRIAAIGVTKPEAGVMATRPATRPVAAPRAVGLPFASHSVPHQERRAPAAARCVAAKADAARPPAATAEPALKPNQPNHSSPAPRTVSGMLFGSISTWPNPLRRPTYRAQARAATPAV